MKTQARPEPIIDAGRLRLVPFGPDHLADPAYVGWLHDARVVAPLNLPRYLAGEVSEAEISEYCQRLIQNDDVWFFAIVMAESQRFIGSLKAGPINRYTGTADLGIMIGATDLWGQGFAQDALFALAHRLMNGEGLRRLTAGAMANNPAMIKVFEKLGFKREGVFRGQDRQGDAYIDHIHLGCLAGELRGAVRGDQLHGKEAQ
jgi:RimJ/RimL family protein N-acetyltransferase